MLRALSILFLSNESRLNCVKLRNLYSENFAQ